MAGTGIPSFDAQTNAFRVARAVLSARLRDGGPADEAEATVLEAEVLPAVRRIAEGVGLTARTTRLDTTTQRDLLARMSTARRRTADGLDVGAGQVVAAANHARLVLAYIPRLPADLVTWPRFRLGSGYADVLAPHGVGETLERVDEIESVLRRAARGHELRPDDHLRRTYAFCETACWLDLRLAPR